MQTRNRDVRFDLSCASGVAIAVGCPEYAAAPPFSPGRRYPEYPFANFTVGCAPNYAYELVRETLRLLGLDERHYGTTHWNPLGEVVRPGDRVVIKPSLPGDELEPGRLGSAECLITHGAVLRAVLDYVHIATCGRGEIIIADIPHEDADTARSRWRLAGLEDIVRFYRGCAAFELQVYDLRPQERPQSQTAAVKTGLPPGDPAGYVVVNLEAEHGGGEYLMPRTLLSADVLISLPKLRTDRSTGLFGNTTNLAQMDPYTERQAAATGESLHRRVEHAAVDRFKRIFPGIGRTEPGPSERESRGSRASGVILDVNRIVTYADADGRCHERPVRRFFSLVDGIIAGEGDAPRDPRPRPAGVIVAGFNPVAVDLACARVVGFDGERIPTLRQSFETHRLPLGHFPPGDVYCRSNLLQYDRRLADFEGACLGFRPHSDWRGRIEFTRLREKAGVLA